MQPNQNPFKFSIEIDKLILKYIWKGRQYNQGKFDRGKDTFWKRSSFISSITVDPWTLRELGSLSVTCSCKFEYNHSLTCTSWFPPYLQFCIGVLRSPKIMAYCSINTIEKKSHAISSPSFSRVDYTITLQ